jgi:hypothetical protein
MSAMLNQLDPVTVLTKFNKIATAGKEIVETNIPTSVVNQLMGLAMKAKAEPISSIAFVPPLIYPGQPDFAKIRSRVGKKIAAAEAADAAGDGKASATPASPTSTAPTSKAPTSTAPTATAPTSGASASSPGKAASSAPKKAKAAAATKTKAGQETDDLGGVCSAR